MSSDPHYNALADQLAENTATVGRYILHRQIARGGMATIHIARLMGDEGFSRIVAAKRLHPEFAEDSEFVAMFLDEARIASKIHHRNIVPVLDVVTTQDEVLLVQEFVHGAPLNWLLNKSRQMKERVPVDIAVAIATQVLAGLHAAHELVDEMGTPLDVVHRDVSPQNVMIANDGTARLLDFGVAKASMAAHTTREGTYKGKLAYSAPEQLRGRATKQSDLYALAVVLWELVVGHRMHGAQSETELVATIMNGQLPTILDTLAPEREWQAIGDDSWSQLEAVDAVVRKGLAADVAQRWTTAVEFEEALTRAVSPAAPSAVAAWVKRIGQEYLEKHDRMIAAEEASWRRTNAVPAQTTSRRTPLPGELRTVPRLKTSPGVDSYLRSHPPAPEQKGSKLMVALLGALVAGVAVGVVLIVQRPPAGKAAEASPAPVTSEPAAAPPVRESKPVVEDKTVAKPAAAETTPTEAIAEPTAEPTQTETAKDSAKSEPVRAEPVRAAPAKRAAAPARVVRQTQAPVRAKDKQEAIAPPGTPAVAETKQEPPKVDCTTPYYFEGTKKIYKPACI